jgi:hypothetical protein
VSGTPLVERGRVRARYERQAWQLQEQINQLTEKCAECQLAVDSAEASLQEKPRLRDRNRFFNWMLNGDLATYERIAPLWQDRQRNSQGVKRITAQLAAKETEIETVVRRGLEGESEYKALAAKLDREKKAKRSCNQLIESIRAARIRISRCDRRLPRTDAVRAAVDQDAREVAELIRAVRNQAADANEKVSPYPSLDPNATKLDTGFLGSNASRNARVKKYNEAKAALDFLERSVKTVINDIAARISDLEEQQREYVRKERAKYNDTSSGL